MPKSSVGRNIDIKGTADTKENKEHVIGNCRKGNSCYIVTENLGELYPAVKWKVELVHNKIGHLAESISKQNVENVGWLV